MTRLVRLYRSAKRIWRYEIERDGVIRWSSLHTRDEVVAREKYRKLQEIFAIAEANEKRQ
jgi:hypothetical protein